MKTKQRRAKKKKKEPGFVELKEVWGFKWYVDRTWPDDKVVIYDAKAAKEVFPIRQHMNQSSQQEEHQSEPQQGQSPSRIAYQNRRLRMLSNQTEPLGLPKK